MRLLATASLTAGPATLEVQPGQYSALFIRVSGTTGGAAADQADVGLVSGTWRDRNFLSLQFQDLMQLNSMELGMVEDTDATPFSYSAMIPASLVGDGNVFDVTARDNMVIRVDLSGAGGVVGAAWTGGNITLLGVPADGLMYYLPSLVQHQPTIAVSGTDVLDVPYENVARIFFFNTTNLDKLQVSRDGQEVVNATVAQLLALSNMECRLESAFTAGFRVDLCRSRSMAEAMPDKIGMIATAGSGGASSPRIVAMFHDYTPDALSRSVALVNAKYRATISRKVRRGHTRPVQVAKRIQAGLGA
jgi:hypothetical protein